LAAGKAQPMTIPDFTKGDAIPAGAKHDWNLGPTGLRGWIFCDKMVTTDARQISITKVEKDSPADGVISVGDVILGVGGKPFSYDPRTEFGKALTSAESEAGGGSLTVTRWRAGKVDEVVVELPVLGSYSVTAPFNCAKSKRILEQGCKALAAIGAPAMQTVPQLLELLTQVDQENDPRGMQQRYLSFALFDDGGMLSGSLEGVDREALYKAVRAGLKNQDGRARGSLGSVYRNLSFEDIRPLLPAIYRAIIEPAPSGEMFADSIRVEGLRLMAKHRIEKGISACVKYTRDQNPWASEHRTPELMKILLSYGTNAKSVIPELTQIANYFEKKEKDFPEELMVMKAKCVRETIRAIEASTNSPKLNRLE
jgi:hypothetical protein